MGAMGGGGGGRGSGSGCCSLSHLEISAVICECECFRRELRLVVHDARSDDRVLDIGAGAQQALALVVPSLGHAAEGIDHDGGDRPRRLT